MPNSRRLRFLLDAAGGPAAHAPRQYVAAAGAASCSATSSATPAPTSCSPSSGPAETAMPCCSRSSPAVSSRAPPLLLTSASMAPLSTPWPCAASSRSSPCARRSTSAHASGRLGSDAYDPAGRRARRRPRPDPHRGRQGQGPLCSPSSAPAAPATFQEDQHVHGIIMCHSTPSSHSHAHVRPPSKPN